MKIAHYDKARDGQWTYFDTGHESNFLFRKGTKADSFLDRKSNGQFLEVCKEHEDEDSTDPRKYDFIAGTSEWLIYSEPMMNLVCDLLNKHEAGLNAEDSLKKWQDKNLQD